VTGKPRKNRPSYEGKRAINQHLHHHHDGVLGQGTVEERLVMHDDLHFDAGKAGTPLGHAHEGYQEGESINDIARRMLADGTAAE